MDLSALTSILVLAASPFVTQKLADLLQTWLARKSDRVVKLKITSEKGSVVEIEYDPQKMKAEDLEELLQKLKARERQDKKNE